VCAIINIHIRHDYVVHPTAMDCGPCSRKLCVFLCTLSHGGWVSGGDCATYFEAVLGTFRLCCTTGGCTVHLKYAYQGDCITSSCVSVDSLPEQALCLEVVYLEAVYLKALNLEAAHLGAVYLEAALLEAGRCVYLSEGFVLRNCVPEDCVSTIWSLCILMLYTW
jgi:hypothetical protein